MRVEFLPGLTNVIRFPLELRARPSLDLLRELAPDVRDVMAIAEAYWMDMPVHELRARVDEETAAYIALHLPANEPSFVRAGFLNKLLEPLVASTIEACHAAHIALSEVSGARDALGKVSSSNRYWSGAQRDRVDALAERAAAFIIDAHARVEQVEGVARAVDYARRGEPWAPRDHEAETDALLAYRRPA